MTRPLLKRGPLVTATGILILVLLAPGATIAEGEPSELEELASWMIGNFSTAVQASENPEFFAINLHIVAIWPDRTDGRWLYVEQAVSEYQDRPYRQRIYRVRELVPGLFETQIFTLPDPTAAVGAWLAVDPLPSLQPEALTEREGCAILLRRRGETFVGSTIATLCTSTLRGASYATSEVVITPDGMVSWDRGFATDGSQVWGTVNGGHVFDRIVPDEEEPAGDSDSDSESEPSSEGVVKPEENPEIE